MERVKNPERAADQWRGAWGVPPSKARKVQAKQWVVQRREWVARIVLGVLLAE